MKLKIEHRRAIYFLCLFLTGRDEIPVFSVKRCVIILEHGHFNLYERNEGEKGRLTKLTFSREMPLRDSYSENSLFKSDGNTW